ncbi:MAG: rRNA maturation RNase YbeY [Dehalococcoidia bacterium]
MGDININFDVSDDSFDIPQDNLYLVAVEAFNYLEIQKSSVSIYFSDDDYVQNLNHQYRGLNEVTDVLSFSNDFEGQYYGDQLDLREGLIEEDFVIPENFQDYLGDIVISFPQACRQSIENQVDLVDELMKLVAHGILHLLGFDHENISEELEMNSITDTIINLVKNND